MLIYNIGYPEEYHEKVHHKETNLNRYFILLLLIKLSYFVYFYIIDNPDKISWLLVIFYYLSLISLFTLLGFSINGKRITIYEMHWTAMLCVSEIASYFPIILNYYFLNRWFMSQKENAYCYIAGIESLFTLLFNVFANCRSLYLAIKKKGRICYHVIIFSIFIVLSIIIHLYVIKITYDIGVKIANKNVIKT